MMRPTQGHFRRSSSGIPSLDSLTRNGKEKMKRKLNSKYDNVKAAIDSGSNILKVNEKFPESKVNARFKKEEFFHRLGPTNFTRILNEGEVECLILDVRETEAFEICHLKDAMSFPIRLLKRSVNVFPIEILNFINKEPKKIIVFYDDNETAAQHSGNLFVEKGVDNIYMLNGGLKEIFFKFPELVIGELEPELPTFSKGTPSVRSDSCRSSMSTSRSRVLPPRKSSSVASTSRNR